MSESPLAPSSGHLPDAALVVPQTLGSYTLGRALTALPFGVVVEATRAGQRERLALLLLADDLTQDQRLRGLLRLEIARAGGLRQPGIARPIEVGDQGGRLYVVYERPAGEPLTSALSGPGELTVPSAVAIVERLAAGLDVAHGRRLSHGAISPAAVLIGTDGAAALIGVGVLAAIDDAGLADRVPEHVAAAFCAPEQAHGRLSAPSADQFALGVLAALLIAEATEGVVPPAAMRAVLEAQQSPDPDRRYRSCAAFAAALAEAAAPGAMAGPCAPSPIAVTPLPPATRETIVSPAPELSPATTAPSERPPVERVAPGSPPPIPKRVPPNSPPPIPQRLPPPPQPVDHSASDPVPETAPIQPAREPNPSGHRLDLAWRHEGHCQVANVPVTPEMRACIDAAVTGSLPVLALRCAVPVGFALFGLVTGFVPIPFLLIMVTIAAFASGAVRAVLRTIGLVQAKRSPSVVRVLGPIRVREREVRENKSTRMVRDLDIGDLDSFGIDEAMYTEVGHAAGFSQQSISGWAPPPDRSTCYEMERAIVTYTRTISRLVFEIRYPSGSRIYRHPDYDDREWLG